MLPPPHPCPVTSTVRTLTASQSGRDGTLRGGRLQSLPVRFALGGGRTQSRRSKPSNHHDTTCQPATSGLPLLHAMEDESRGEEVLWCKDGVCRAAGRHLLDCLKFHSRQFAQFASHLPLSRLPNFRFSKNATSFQIPSQPVLPFRFPASSGRLKLSAMPRHGAFDESWGLCWA